jgi:branched-chain amino acid transport system ATP-binding protein
MPEGALPASVLEVEGLVTYRGPAQVLRGVALQVGPREAVCLVGRNGAGKTTTMESIMGLLPVRSGRVRFQGREITRLDPSERARLGLGYAPEDTGVFPELTVAENLALGLWLGAARRGRQGRDGEERESRIYELFPELRSLRERRGLHLSGGEKKMVAIARAMALDPAVLLLDEAFEGLAPVVVRRFADAVARIKEMGISLLIAECNLATASLVADRLYILDRGEVVFCGTPAEVFRDEEALRTVRG